MYGGKWIKFHVNRRIAPYVWVRDFEYESFLDKNGYNPTTIVEDYTG